MFDGNAFGTLDQKLQAALQDLHYEKPTPIQEQAIAPLLKGRDMIGIAQTGTGKTAAFMLPILHHLLRERRPRRVGHPRALILSPTRELAAQTAENVRLYSKYAALPFACVFGGVSQFGQVKDIKKGAEIVVACPGRLMDLMSQGFLYLDQVECFVLDEADRMLDMGFFPDVKRIVSKLPVKRQALFFSATMNEQISRLAADLVHDPVQVNVSPKSPTVEKIDQKVFFVEKANKDALLVHLLQTHPEWRKVMVFTKMRHGADRIVKKLLRADVSCAAIHSDKTQNQRMRALDGFRKGQVRVLVATDIASRGIDVPAIDCVVNMELPLETENYVHRIGRTARAGGSGLALSFVTRDERGQLKAVERFIKKTIPLDCDHPFHAAEGMGRETLASHESLPPAPWVRPASGERGKGPHKGKDKGRGRRTRRSFKGRRQVDFGQRPSP